MQTSRVLALAALVASCNVDKLLNDAGGEGSPSAPPGAELVFSSQPTDATAGEPITPPPTVTLQDSAGQPDTSFDGSVTVALGANPGGAALEGDATVEAVDGVATFSNLSVSNPGDDYTLSATAPGTGLTAATSSAFDIAAPPPPPPPPPPNQPPSVNAGPDANLLVGGLTYTLNATFSDPDNDGPWSYTIDWDHGSPTTGTATSQGSIRATHTYPLLPPGSYRVRVTVVDSHGATGSDELTVRVVL